MFQLQKLTFAHPGSDILFENLNIAIAKGQKVALIGNNGAGKSTLLQLLTGALQATSGNIILEEKPYTIPQHFGQYNHLSIAQALKIDQKINALQAILNGDTSVEQFEKLNEDWTIEERCSQALAYWDLSIIDLNRPLSSLSGGQKTKVFLAGLLIHEPQLVLMDEPSNHLDKSARVLLQQYIADTKATVLIISHDKALLNNIDTILELTKAGLNVYGGNYAFYESQKAIEIDALKDDLQHKTLELKKAKEKERETNERKQKLDARGKKKQEKAGLPKILINAYRNNAEQSTSKLNAVHNDKISGIKTDLQALKASLPDLDKMRLSFDQSQLHYGKRLFEAKAINVQYTDKPLWKENISFIITAGKKYLIEGDNGTGKTSLINVIINDKDVSNGEVFKSDFKWVYIDQEYSLINNDIKVHEQLQLYNQYGYTQSELNNKLSHFLFFKNDWDKPCSALSGGERMRLLLCCLSISKQAPDMIILDEPTNNLDIQNVEILINAIQSYKGTLIVVSHDQAFVDALEIDHSINCNLFK